MRLYILVEAVQKLGNGWSSASVGGQSGLNGSKYRELQAFHGDFFRDAACGLSLVNGQKSVGDSNKGTIRT